MGSRPRGAKLLSDQDSSRGHDLALDVAAVIRELRRTLQAAGRLRSFHGVGVDIGTMDALDVLADRELVRTSQLADRLKIDSSTASRAVDQLCARGFAERLPDPDDGRVVMVTLTAQGRQHYDRVNQERTQMMQKLLRGVSESDRLTFTQVTNHLIGAMEREMRRLGSGK